MWNDNWTAVTVDGKRSAQFEHTFLITEYGVEILTARNDQSPAFEWEIEETIEDMVARKNKERLQFMEPKAEEESKKNSDALLQLNDKEEGKVAEKKKKKKKNKK